MSCRAYALSWNKHLRIFLLYPLQSSVILLFNLFPHNPYFMLLSTLSLSSSDHIYVHPPSLLCDGFSAAMLNFTNRSIPTAQSPSLWPCFTGVVRWWTGSSWNTGLGEERACCVSRKLRGGGAEGKGGEERGERPGCSMRVDRLAVMLSNSPQRRTAGGMREEREQKGAEDDEGEGIMFSHQRGAGGWAEGMCLCTSIYVNGFVSRPEVPEAMP